MKLKRLLTPKLLIIAALRKNISAPRKLPTGVQQFPVFFRSLVQVQVLARRSLLLESQPQGQPLGGVGGAFALASSELIVASKKLDSKIKKHREIVALAIAKRDTVCRLYSKALSDNRISDSEFQSIMAEFSQYNVLKESVRSKITRNSSRPDIEKIKKDVRSEVEVEFQKKKINALVAGSN